MKMNNNLREAVQQALEALEISPCSSKYEQDCHVCNAIAALRNALIDFEPDWGESKTLPTEIWKNSMYSLQDRLLMVDGAVTFYREVEENLRKQIEKLQSGQDPVEK